MDAETEHIYKMEFSHATGTVFIPPVWQYFGAIGWLSSSYYLIPSKILSSETCSTIKLQQAKIFLSVAYYKIKSLLQEVIFFWHFLQRNRIDPVGNHMD